LNPRVGSPQFAVGSFWLKVDGLGSTKLEVLTLNLKPTPGEVGGRGWLIRSTNNHQQLFVFELELALALVLACFN
jgi:hypothetical protein